MAEINLGEMYEPVTRRDPVTGKEETYLRVRHDHTYSARLDDYRECMRRHLAGHHYRGHGAAVDEHEVRDAFRQAAEACAREDKAFPSDRRER